MWWRAPEVLFGSGNFNAAIDLWSLGMVLAQMGSGDRFQVRGNSERSYAQALFQQLGTPDDTTLTSLPQWVRLESQKRRPWPSNLVRRLGAPGIDLLNAMLAWVHEARPTAAQVQAHAFVVPERFGLHLRTPVFLGARHSWNISVGTTAAEVLQWLRGDAALQPGLHPDADMASFSSRFSKSECGRKRMMAGSLGDVVPLRGKTSAGSRQLRMHLQRALPLLRLQTWRMAFLHVNSAAFATLLNAAKTAVRKLGKEVHGLIGQQFLDLDFPQWFASCADLIFVEPGNNQETGFWAESEHEELGNSVLCLGVTLYGRQTLACSQDFGPPDVSVLNEPGTVFLGQLTGPRHTITHESAEEGDLLEVPGIGLFGVNVIARTSLYVFDDAICGQPSSAEAAAVFAALARTIREAFAVLTLRLPTLEECQAHSPV